MAACSIGGALNVKILNFHSEFSKTRCNWITTQYKTKCSRLLKLSGSRGSQIWHGPFQDTRFDRLPWRSGSSSVVCCASSSGKNSLEEINLEDESTRSQVIPGGVESLILTLCDTTSIAEIKLKRAGFQLHVKRNFVQKDLLPPAPSPPPATDTARQAPDSNGSATSLTIIKPKPLTGGIQRILDTASDEGLVILQSPKVGYFRRSRTIKGKRAPPSCKEKQEVKEGQVLCYIEQLGGEIPIESDVTGEVIKILREDGEPVGYGDALIALLPSFPGIKKLQ
ncbi:uncharacterized protein [Typha angustifolia]|uniref:uncharacterized protein n=1 Tax=Typha angustifolia TaxID=59011 RepID=UPI003C2B1D80